MPGPDNRPVPPSDGRSGEGNPCRSIGGYHLLRRIGEGAMSRVFLGYDPAGLCQVAVKLLADHLAADKQFVNRFYREARMSRVLSHPNIVRGLAHGFDQDVGKHYLILEYVDGPNALALLTRLGRLPVGGVVRVGVEIGRGLQHLHALGYVHRDVKPDNILLGPDGSAKLADLGLAKRLSGDVELTTTNQGVGTPHYMPYEQAVNGDLVDGRSDLFALGATLYHLLTGTVPFQGETHEEIVREKAQDAYQSVREVRPDVPPELDLILARTLARDPRARFQTAGELVAALVKTGLAADGPMWTPTPEGEHTAHAGGPHVGRTRPDLPLVRPPDSLGSGPRPAVGAPPRPSAVARLVEQIPAESGKGRVVGWPLLVITFLAGLAGFTGLRTACRSDRPTEPTRPAAHPPGSTAKVPGGPIPADSQ